MARVLIIAGSDSGGGAGIQADIKAVTALGGYAATAITAITVQNTLGVSGIHEVPIDILDGQVRAVLTDIGADAIKTGMLHSIPVIETVARVIDDHPVPHVVVDPVMVAKGGARLLREDAVAAVRAVMLPRATLLTPNGPEAEVLADLGIATAEDCDAAAQTLLGLGASAVLLKGGHLDSDGETIRDRLYHADGRFDIFESPRQVTASTHGTGCTLASAIACGLAQHRGLEPAVDRAIRYVQAAIRTAPGYGAGHGPLNHAVTVDPDRVF